MLPNDIEKILLKNETIIAEEISDINTAINRISASLMSASNALMGEVEVYAKNTGISNQEKEIELHQESLAIRKYITHLHTIQSKCTAPSAELDIHDVIVLSNTKICSYRNHESQDIIVGIPVLQGGGAVQTIKIVASYCPVCKRYTILKDQFQNIDGVIMCRVIDNTYSNEGTNSTEIEIDQKQSIIFQYGYNVQSQKNLSTQQRHIILASLVESKIQTRRQIMDHLSTLIERGNKIPSWKDATNKWKEDRNYVASYNVNNLPSVITDRIILKYKE